MATISEIKFKRSKTAGQKPAVASLKEGELAINLVDKKLFTNDGEHVVDITLRSGGTVEGSLDVNGNTSSNKFLVKNTQPTEPNAATRKDYVDGKLNDKVSKSGDTMSGDLRITTPGDTRLRLKDVEFRSNAGNDLIISTPGKAIHVRPKGNDVPDQQLVLDTNGTLSVDRVITRSVQPGDAGSLTRKDYVDARANEKVSKTGDTMTGELLATKGVKMGINWLNAGLIPGNKDGATWTDCNIDLSSWFGIGISSAQTGGVRTIVINARNGDFSTKGSVSVEKELNTFNLSASNKISVGPTGIRRRTNDSALIAGDGNIGLEFPTGVHSSGFKNGYLLEQIKGFLDTKLTFKQHLQKRNLNDIKEPGFYYQDANANTPGLNYPEDNAGSLEVYNAAGVIQVYRVYNTGRSYQRAFYNNGPWTSWTRNFSYGDPALCIGYQGVSGLGNNSIAIGDNDTGFRQVGDGILEIVANSQRVAQLTNGHAYFDKGINSNGISMRENASIMFYKAGANPRNIRMFHAGDANRGGRLEIAGENSYLAYFEERPNNGHMISFNGDTQASGQIISSVNIRSNNGTIESHSDSNSHIWFRTANGTEKGVIYSGGDKVLRYRCVGGQHLFENRIRVPAQGNRPGGSGSGTGGAIFVDGTTSTAYGSLISGWVQRGGWGDWKTRASGVLVYTDSNGASNVWKAVHDGRDWIAAMDVYSPTSGPYVAKLHVGSADFTFQGDGNALAGAWTNTSDKRLKTDFIEIDNALEKVETLNAVTYRKKFNLESEEYSEQREAGLIAQDVQEVLPEAVSVHGDDEILGVNYAGVTALLVNAVKELSAEVKSLKQEIELLKSNTGK